MLMGVKIVHFSDPHAGGGAEDILAYFDKRWVGVFNYRFRRRFKHDLRNLSAAVDYILSTRPDVAVCTGDLTSSGQPGEFETVREILQPLRDSGIPFFYLPGNHDCYVTRPKCVAAVNSMVEYLSSSRYKFSDMPFVETVCGLDFIVLNCSRPSNLLCSWGFLYKKDAQFIEDFCRQEKLRPRILLCHYPMFEDHPVLRVRHRLFGEKPIRRLLENGTIDLSLCGHVHKPFFRPTAGGGRGENIAGSVTRNGTFSELEYDEKSGVFSRKVITV